MATNLIGCVDCGHLNSAAALACPACGRPDLTMSLPSSVNLSSRAVTRSSLWLHTFITCFLLLGFLALVYSWPLYASGTDVPLLLLFAAIPAFVVSFPISVVLDLLGGRRGSAQSGPYIAARVLWCALIGLAVILWMVANDPG